MTPQYVIQLSTRVVNPLLPYSTSIFFTVMTTQVMYTWFCAALSNTLSRAVRTLDDPTALCFSCCFDATSVLASFDGYAARSVGHGIIHECAALLHASVTWTMA
ncbi:hypothetical protein M405DRAFT_810001 [Rhizopogon salebrosus TDB-379]|nr:hypothetical protein M405DRAFT_810001 [Rhizopogon salebrosus TDB-379]